MLIEQQKVKVLLQSTKNCIFNVTSFVVNMSLVSIVYIRVSLSAKMYYSLLELPHIHLMIKDFFEVDLSSKRAKDRGYLKVNDYLIKTIPCDTSMR